LTWSICGQVLSGIGSICTSAVATFGRVIGREHHGSDAGLKMPPGTSIVPI
jgi:hypothetical protein